MGWSRYWFGFLGTLVMALPAEAGQLTYWRFNHDQQRLELTTDEGVQPRVMLVANPTRLVIDLPNTNLGKLPREQDGKRKIEAIRAGQFDRQTTRIVIEFKQKYGLPAAAVRVRGLTPNRWFVQLPQPEQLSRSERDRTAQLPPIAIAVPPPNQGTAIASNPSLQKITVVIDPGHGGPDPGAVGINGLQEKRIVLPIAQNVVTLLQARGLNAILTRTQDQDLDLAPRVALAEKMKAKVFVSIHANAISLSYPEVNGLETYYYSTGAQLARTIHRQILSQVKVRDRGVRQARFYVLRYTSMPATLVEVGFVTGREDAPKLADPTYQQQLAQAIAAGILDYLKLR